MRFKYLPLVVSLSSYRLTGAAWGNNILSHDTGKRIKGGELDYIAKR